MGALGIVKFIGRKHNSNIARLRWLSQAVLVSKKRNSIIYKSMITTPGSQLFSASVRGFWLCAVKTYFLVGNTRLDKDFSKSRLFFKEITRPIA